MSEIEQKKRSFNEMNDDNNHYTCDHSESKITKFNSNIEDNSNNSQNKHENEFETKIETKEKESLLPPIKLLFLDVDGVLNQFCNEEIEPVLIKRLEKIIKKTNCKIVLSSSWRLYDRDKIDLFIRIRDETDIAIYNDLDITPNIYIGDTPDLYSFQNDKFNDIFNDKTVRTEEILYFLNNNMYEFDVTHWCVVDDMNLGVVIDTNDNNKVKPFVGFKEHFCHTMDTDGLTEEKMLQIMEILTK
eukprot:148432_1